MFEIEVSRRGLDLYVVADTFSVEVAQKAIERLAAEAEAEMFFEAPWRSGKLAQSIVKQVDGLEASIGPLASYAYFVEKGTATHEIRPIRARVLRFQNGRQIVFSALVRHPGTKANPFIQRTAEQLKVKANAVLDEVWKNYTAEDHS